MVFLIQNSQNRESAAIQVNWTNSYEWANSLVGIEHLTDDELEDIRSKCEARAKAAKTAEHAVKKTSKAARRAADRKAG